MIEIQVRKNQHDRITGFDVHGHSGFAEEGRDIVCAAVSTLLQTAIVGVSEVLGIDLDFIREKEYIFFELPGEMPQDKANKAYFLMHTVYQALLGIREEYSRYIFIQEVLGVSKKNMKYTNASTWAPCLNFREKEKSRKGGSGMEDNNCNDFGEKCEKKKIPWDKLLGVALLGAVGSAILYYVFLQMGEEQRLAIKENIVSIAKQAVAKHVQVEGD